MALSLGGHNVPCYVHKEVEFIKAGFKHEKMLTEAQTGIIAAGAAISALL